MTSERVSVSMFISVWVCACALARVKADLLDLATQRHSPYS